jgi:hypothetical protein
MTEAEELVLVALVDLALEVVVVTALVCAVELTGPVVEALDRM